MHPSDGPRGSSTIGPDETSAAAIRGRARAWAAIVYSPITTAYRLSVVAAVLGLVVALAIGVGLHNLLAAAVAGLAVTSAGFAAAWWPFAAPDLRGALELVSDHDCHERADWKLETGSSVPVGVPAMRHWLLAHPTGPGRASVLLRFGKLEEAGRAIDEIEPKTPEEAFGVEILRRTRVLLAGDAPDVSDLHVSWQELPDLRERRHRRECLALLDAQIAASTGGDPIAVLASARREIGEVHPSMRAPRLIGRLYLVAAAVVVVPVLVSAAVSF